MCCFSFSGRGRGNLKKLSERLKKLCNIKLTAQRIVLRQVPIIYYSIVNECVPLNTCNTVSELYLCTQWFAVSTTLGWISDAPHTNVWLTDFEFDLNIATIQGTSPYCASLSKLTPIILNILLWERPQFVLRLFFDTSEVSVGFFIL